MMSMWAREYNFTWDIYADIDGDWGLNPVSGTITYMVQFLD
jgi:hypothetical protein